MERTKNDLKTLARYRVFDDLLEEVFLIGHDFRVLYRNKALIDASPLPKDLPNGFCLIENIPGIEKTQHFADIKKTMAHDEPSVHARLLDLSGRKKRYIETRSTPVPEGVLVLTVDVTKRMALGAQLKKQNKKLDIKVKKSTELLLETIQREQRLNQLKSAFVSMASHEFRTPLATMMTSVSMVEHYEGKADIEKRRKYLNVIKAAIIELKAIVNDFLSFDKLESGKLVYHPTNVKVTDYFKEIRDELQLLCAAGQTIHYRHTGSKSEFALDPHIIKNVAYNLLSNALKYSPEGGDVGFKSELTKKRLKFTVTDQGIGIPQEDQDKLFKKFFRAGNVHSLEGSGLGLHLVKRYVEMAKGEIRFNSEAGKGTSFIVELPRIKA